MIGVIDLDPKNPDRNYYYNNKVNAGMYVMEKGICDYLKAGQIKQDLGEGHSATSH